MQLKVSGLDKIKQVLDRPKPLFTIPCVAIGEAICHRCRQALLSSIASNAIGTASATFEASIGGAQLLCTVLQSITAIQSMSGTAADCLVYFDGWRGNMRRTAGRRMTCMNS